MITCSHCKQEKHPEDFYNDKHKKNGKKPRCKPCDSMSIDRNKRAAYEKEYWNARREKRRQIARNWYYRNKQKHSASRAAYLLTEKGKACYRKYTQKRYALRKNAYIEDVDPRLLFVEQKGACYLCSRSFKFKEMELDHVVPLSRGGMHEVSNCKLACVACNRSKGAKLLEELTYQVV